MSGEVVGTVKAEGDGEQAVIGADGLIYVNSEEAGEVVVFDPKSLEVKKRFPIGMAKVPTGLAYDPKTNRLFIGCRNEPKMVVMDAATGKVINRSSANHERRTPRRYSDHEQPGLGGVAQAHAPHRRLQQGIGRLA